MRLSMIELRPDTEAELRKIFPLDISDTDMEFVADWFLMMGIATVKSALIKHPGLTVGALINLTFKLRDS